MLVSRQFLIPYGLLNVHVFYILPLILFREEKCKNINTVEVTQSEPWVSMYVPFEFTAKVRHHNGIAFSRHSNPYCRDVSLQHKVLTILPRSTNNYRCRPPLKVRDDLHYDFIIVFYGIS